MPPCAVQVYLQTAPGAEEGWNANFSSMMTKLLQESYDGSKVQRDAQQRTEALATAAEVPGLPPLPDLPPKVRGSGVKHCAQCCVRAAACPLPKTYCTAIMGRWRSRLGGIQMLWLRCLDSSQ